MSYKTQRSFSLAVLLLTFALTFLPEFALVERKYALFQGGYGAPYPLDSVADISLFFAMALACHIGLILMLYWLASRLNPKKGDCILFNYNFVFFTVAALVTALTIKFKVLSYFSDAISFRLIKKLGGGSLTDAFLFVLDEASLILGGVAAVAVVYLIGLRLLRRLRKTLMPPAASAPWQPATGWCVAALTIVVGMVGTLFLANDSRSVHYSLSRFFAFNLFSEAIAKATDFDRDGYSIFDQPADDFPFDPDRHPFALDIPGNGIDEDGLEGDFTYENTTLRQAPILGADRQHVVLIVLESTRGDALGRVVDGVEITPNINALAEEGTSIGEAYSHVGFTIPSLKSLFTGSISDLRSGRSLFRDLKSNGYQVAVFSGQPESFGGIAEAVAMKESSDVFVDAETLEAERASPFAAKGSLLVDGQILLREFDRHFGEAAAWRDPTFVYVNIQSSHFPYYHEGMKMMLPIEPIPRSEIRIGNHEWIEKTYWNSVAYADWLIGQYVQRLKALGVYDDTLVVVTADHGESLFDDGFLGHGHVINRPQTHIPLVINRAGVQVDEPIGLRDYYDLIMGLLGAEGPAPQSGEPAEFQFIYDLDEPQSIGLVEAGGRWTTLNFDTWILEFKDLNRFVPYDDVDREPELQARAQRLIFEWERERWRAHLTQQASQAVN